MGILNMNSNKNLNEVEDEYMDDDNDVCNIDNEYDSESNQFKLRIKEEVAVKEKNISEYDYIDELNVSFISEEEEESEIEDEYDEMIKYCKQRREEKKKKEINDISLFEYFLL